MSKSGFVLAESLYSAFAKFMKPEYLYAGVLVFVLLIIAIVLAVYFILFDAKRKSKRKKEILKHLEVWISRAILEELEKNDAGGFDIPPKFKRILQKKDTKKIVIDELLHTKKSLVGASADNIVLLYEQLGLKMESLLKMRSALWYVKARGIQELYEMEQRDTQRSIYKYTNSSEEFVRNEAQTGIIHLMSFQGLRFLDIVSYPISEWQQLKMINQLSQLPFTELPNLHRWLKSPNPTVVAFALKITDFYQQFQMHDIVVETLRHYKENVRIQAITTLGRITNETTAQVLAEHFPEENFIVKQKILDVLSLIATSAQMEFLFELLNDENNYIKLKAAKALARCGSYGLQVLSAKATMQPHPYANILSHVKDEINN